MTPSYLDLAGKLALAIGGGRGIALCTARSLVNCGARIAIFGRNAASQNGVRASLGRRSTSEILDLADEFIAIALRDRIRKQFGRIDVLVNNATLAARTSLCRFGKLVEVTGAAIFLASPSASYVTEHTLTVDRGWTAA